MNECITFSQLAVGSLLYILLSACIGFILGFATGATVRNGDGE